MYKQTELGTTVGSCGHGFKFRRTEIPELLTPSHTQTLRS